jgi:putative nucleotidyltransferase with HDIG domain
VAHSIQVSRVALLVADRLAEKGVTLNAGLVRAGALVHDITKMTSMGTGEFHTVTGERHLARKGYPEVGRIVGQHVKLDHYFGSGTPDEAEVVNYSDKRIMHTEIVSFEERLEDIMSRYGLDPAREERIRQLEVDTRRVEERIFSIVDISPQDVAGLLPADGLECRLEDFRTLV